MPFLDFIPAGEDTGAIDNGGFQDFVPAKKPVKKPVKEFNKPIKKVKKKK